jgi:hypothetical protein
MYTISIALSLCLLTAGLSAQVQTPDQEQEQDQHPPEHHHMPDPPAEQAWTWATDANVFVGYNYQQRRFADFAAIESQNWFMLAGTRKAGPGHLTLTGMLSLEPLTIGRLVYAGDGGMERVYAFSPSGERVPFGGSPQLFQTGESYQQVPYVNVQHPHDLFMSLGATYRVERPNAAYVFGAALVGEATLGPTAFMHRESARDNPQVR